MSNQYLHKPNLSVSRHKPKVIWDSKSLPIPIDIFDTHRPLQKSASGKSFNFWLTIRPSLSDDSINKMLSHQCIETIRISSSKYKNEKEIHDEVVRVKKIIGEQNISLAIDLSGPKVRISHLDLLSGRDELEILKGEIIALVPDSNLDIIKDKRLQNTKVIPYKETIPLKKDAKFLLISDGWSQFEIIKHDEIAIYCEALSDCMIYNYRGIDIAGLYDTVESIPIETIDLINKLNSNGSLEYFEWICLSFCNTKKSIEEMKRLSLPPKAKLMAKIETMRGIENIDEISAVTDGIMIARGDLAVQLSLYKKDILQVEDLLRTSSKKHNKKCVIATRIGDSLDGINTSLSSEEIYKLKHELLFDDSLCLMLTNETLENETAYKNFLIILKAINNLIYHN
ncbi:MAG: Pyruvate kinase [Bacteroidia bacterium]|nr:Pyruvate kinase [Bacteroidia bacterium]